jgi:hypothetical protein
MATSQTAGSAVNPQVPVANLGNTYINGMRLLWLSTTSFSVGIGQARDSTDTVDIIMGGNQYSSASNPGAEQGLNTTPGVSAAVTVKTSVSGAGGVDVGTIAGSKNYSVFAIGDSRGFNSGSAVMSLAAPTVGPSLPLGYDCWRYVGSVSMDSTPHVRAFTQTGAQALRTIWYDGGTNPGNNGVSIPSSGTGGSTTYVNLGVLTTLVPQTAMECIISTDLTPNSAGNAVYLAPPTIDNGTTATVGSMAALSAEVTGHAQLADLRCPCSLPNATQIAALTITSVVTILYATTSSSDAVVFTLVGYVDQL